MKFFYSTVFICFALICGCSQISTVSKSAKAPHFDAVNKHLDLGGVFYLYVDLDKDVEKAAALLNEAYHESEMANNNELEGLDFFEIAQIMGLDAVDAFGASSYKDGNMFVNKSFLRTSQGRKGLLKVLGEEPKKFNILDLAPNDASLLVEQDVHLKSAYEVLVQLLLYFKADNVLKEIEDGIQDPVLPDLFSIKEVLDASNTRIMASFSIDNSRKIELMDYSFPHIDFMFAFENLGIIFDTLMEAAGMIPFLRTEKSENWETIEFLEELPELGYKLVLKRDLSTNRLYMASNIEYFTKCKEAKGSFKNNEDFLKASTNMNVLEGNSFAYYSSSFFTDLASIFDQIEMNDKAVSWVISMIKLILPKQSGAQLMVSSNIEDGILTKSRTYYSYKGSLITSVYFNPAALLLLTAGSGAPLSHILRPFLGNNEPEALYLEEQENILEADPEMPQTEDEAK
jgi:hypothetical protein